VSRISPRTITLRNNAVVIVRNPSPQDAHSFVQIMRDVASEGQYTMAEPDEVSWTDNSKREDIREHLEEPGDLALVAEVSGKVVGFIEFENGRRRRTIHSGMFSIFIERGYREIGVGSALITSLLDWAAQHPFIEKVTLAVFETNKRAIAVYEKLGFQIEGRCPRDMKFGTEYVDSILMYKFVK
jgi:RimJ/RimL family protein N-acetyltransferase